MYIIERVFRSEKHNGTLATMQNRCAGDVVAQIKVF